MSTSTLLELLPLLLSPLSPSLHQDHDQQRVVYLARVPSFPSNIFVLLPISIPDSVPCSQFNSTPMVKTIGVGHILVTPQGVLYWSGCFEGGNLKSGIVEYFEIL